MDPKPPKPHEDFVDRYPGIGEAWDALRRAEQESGPLDEKTIRLVKLGAAIGALREGSVHSAVRKALSAGCSAEELEQVIALAASTIGLPSAVAAFTWIREVIQDQR